MVLKKTVHICVVAWIVILAGAFQQTAAQNLAERGIPIAWQYSRLVPARTIRGVIMHEDGTPLSGDLVSIAGRPKEGALSGPDGRFELTRLATGPAELRIQIIGHKSASVDLVILADAGVTVFALLPGQPVGGRCELAEQTLSPFLQVVDDVTGEAPRSMPTLRLERDGESLTSTPVRPPGEGMPYVFYPPRIESSATYRAIVTADGYRDWVRDDVRIEVEPGLCASHFRHEKYVARLIPLR